MRAVFVPDADRFLARLPSSTKLRSASEADERSSQMTARGLGLAFLAVLAAVLAVAAVLVGGSDGLLYGAFAVGLGLAVALNVVPRRRTSTTRQPTQGSGRPQPDSWWIGALVPFGLGVWATFLYLGVRT